MNALNDISPLLANALQTSIAVTALILLVLLVRKPFARNFGAKAAYALWLVPLARLFMPPLPANTSLFGFLAPTQDAPGTTEVAAPHWISARVDTQVEVPAPAEFPPVVKVDWAAAPEASEPGMMDGIIASLPSMLIPVWLIGITVMLGLAWRRQAIFHQLIRDDSSPASDPVNEMTHEIAAQLKVRRRFEVRTSLLNGSPLVTGFLKPVILLPEWFEADYSPRERRDALTHELMHL